MANWKSIAVTTAALLVFPLGLQSAESVQRKKAGLKSIQFITPVSAVTPGASFTVGLRIVPEEGYHTYWKGPGIVGVATSIEWTLPEGFSASEILWPPPEKTDMAGISANGYRSEKILLTDITVPDHIDKDNVKFRGKVAWMACATECNPGVEEIVLTLPVNHSGKPSDIDHQLSAQFEEIRSSFPVAAPASWSFNLRREASELIILEIDAPGAEFADADAIQFFSYDHQVDSDQPQNIKISEEGTLILALPRPEFAPKSPTVFSGVIHHAGGWSEIENDWIEISVPWQSATISDE